jgi:tRNA threonylcarbamoyladenosine biosynthesis protein TsaE
MNKEVTNAAEDFMAKMKDRKVFAFHGKMGAGKTTLIKAICRELGVEDTVNSPTFSIINEYRRNTGGTPIYHFDFYRINHPDEVEDLGLEEYFFSGALCLIEWPEIIDRWLPDNTAHVFIRENPDGTRSYNIS